MVSHPDILPPEYLTIRLVYDKFFSGEELGNAAMAAYYRAKSEIFLQRFNGGGSRRDLMKHIHAREEARRIERRAAA